MPASKKDIQNNIQSCSDYLAGYKDFSKALELIMSNHGVMPNDQDILSSYVEKRIEDGYKALADYNSELVHIENEEVLNVNAQQTLDEQLGDLVDDLEKKMMDDLKPFMKSSDDDTFLDTVKEHIIRQKGEPAKVGTIMYSSWGYGQTNIDFYQIVGMTPSGKSVKIRKIHSRGVATGDMQRNEMPDVGNFDGKVMTKRIKNNSCSGHYSSEYCSVWDGRPKSSSSCH